ncbi:MAG: DUF2202 domain-containing protein [Deltaproteobacteria bacterium]|nr:DUF2202 domain-containing protein [Deltaproteobacteria bacterium]
MKKNLTTICMSLIILLLGTTLSFAGNGKLGTSKAVNSGSGSGMAALPYDYPSAAEISALTYMVEEEKVARDVYTVLYESTAIPAFANIAAAEQKHMDAIIALLNKYELVNPVAELAAGNFNNGDLQALYNQLVAAGQVNDEEALLVGATIEDVDIFDLLHELTVVDNEDISAVFTNLLEGSKNHLRAFNALLLLNGYSAYQASEYLTQAEIDAILDAAPSNGSKKGSANNNTRLPQQSNMIDANGDGICDLLQ